LQSVNRVCSLFLRKILLRMKELGLNNTALAKRMNVSRPYVVKVLSGDVNITFGTAMKFAKALGMDFVPGLAPVESSNAIDSDDIPYNAVEEVQ